MGLFTRDLYRNLAIGFALGAAISAWQIAPAMAQSSHQPGPVAAAVSAR